jgi:hypothetical protein
MAIVGGTSSALGGGKFANGAVSGAFIQMFNYETDMSKSGLPEEGNWAEEQDFGLKVINTIARGIYRTVDVIGEAFSGLSNVPRAFMGAYEGLSSMEARINSIENIEARSVGQAIFIKASGGAGGPIGGILLDSAQGASMIESEIEKSTQK